jgi:hypothetical protein
VVALKFRRDLEPNALATLRRESKLFGLLAEAMAEAGGARPPIAALLRDLLDEDPPALVMEHVAGGNLRQRLERRGTQPMTVEESLRVIRDATEALAFAHSRGVVHRDLSPENILLDPMEGRWKLADFGVGALTIEAEMSFERSAPASGAESGPGDMAGKVHYMAPEQRSGERAGPPADIYALGVLWAQLLTGRFGAGLPATWARRVPSEVKPLLARCLEDDPAERWASGSHLLERIDGLGGAFFAGSGSRPRPLAKPLISLGGFQQVLHLEGHQDWVACAAISPDGKRALTGGLDRSAILWNLETGASERVFREHRNTIADVAFSHDGALMATAGWDGTARVWDVATGETLHRFGSEGGHHMLAVAFDGTGARLRTASRVDLAAWNLKTGELVAEKILPARLLSAAGASSEALPGVCRALLAPNGSRALFGLNRGETLVASAKIDPRDPAEFGRAEFCLEGHSWLVGALAISRDGRFALSAGLEDVFELWDLNMPKGLRVFEGHEHWIRALAFSPGGRLVASASRDRTIRLWDSFNGEELAGHDSERRAATCLAFNPDGQRLMAGFDDGSVTMWELPEKLLP